MISKEKKKEEEERLKRGPALLTCD